TKRRGVLPMAGTAAGPTMAGEEGTPVDVLQAAVQTTTGVGAAAVGATAFARVDATAAAAAADGRATTGVELAVAADGQAIRLGAPVETPSVEVAAVGGGTSTPKYYHAVESAWGALCAVAESMAAAPFV